MDEERYNISHMECWLVRMAQKKWNKTPKEIVTLFRNYKLLEIVAECYDFLHYNSYSCALSFLEQILANQGITV